MRRVTFTAIAILVSGVGTFSQNQRLQAPPGVDLTGNWASAGWTEGGGRGGGNDRRSFDFLGIPLSEAGKAWTLSHDQLQVSQYDRQCSFYTPMYHVFGFGPMGIWREDEYQTGTTLAWVIAGWADFKSQVMWMDGRPHPGPYAPHRVEGFTTGVWENDVLVTTTTHLTQGMLHRRAPHSDRATLTMRFSRHGDILTLTGRIDDPVYLAEPLYVSREWTLGANQTNRASWPCSVAFEGVPAGQVQHHLPGQHPNIAEITTLFGIPEEAVMGGAETMYPEYRKKLKDTYKRPEPRRPAGATP